MASLIRWGASRCQCAKRILEPDRDRKLSPRPCRISPRCVWGLAHPGPIRPKALRALKLCPSPSSSGSTGTSSSKRARGADTWRIGTASTPAGCTTWSCCTRVARANWSSPIRNIAAAAATSTSMPTRPIWRRPSVTIPIASSAWPSAPWSKTACRTSRPVGGCGATFVCSCLGRPSKTGGKPGKKKAHGQVEHDYLDWALADFSGYIAADEVYDGPFCVLSIVDNHTFKRVFYQVLERHQAPTQAIVAAFFGCFREALHARGLQVAGITT